MYYEWFKEIDKKKTDRIIAATVDESLVHLKTMFQTAFVELQKNPDQEYNPFTSSMFEVLRLGGDTDTNASIVGGLLGASYGVSIIETRFIENMLHYQIVRENMGTAA